MDRHALVDKHACLHEWDEPRELRSRRGRERTWTREPQLIWTRLVLSSVFAALSAISRFSAATTCVGSWRRAQKLKAMVFMLAWYVLSYINILDYL
jgi:hypothetical protein